MTISRRQRKVEENKLYRSNSKKKANINLKKNMTVLGAGLFFGGISAQAGTALTSHQVFADTFSNGDQAVSNGVTANNGIGMITPRGVGDQNFISYIGNSAQKLAENNDLYASVMIAQAMIESGWGTSGLASAPNYNLFGIKGSYKGTAVNMPTQEDDGTGTLYSIQSNFKKYPSYKESLEDYVSLLRGGVSGNPQMYAGTWKSNTSSYKDATAFLTGKYATDTTYANKLNNIIEKYNLSRFDEPSDATDQNQNYVFAQGDTLQSVADKFNISLGTLMNLNGLKTSSYVYPGKTLVVNQVVGADTESVNDPVTAGNTSVAVTSDADSIYNDNDRQAPVIVQDETDGVKQYDPSQATDQVSVSVNNKADVTQPVSNTNNANNTNNTNNVATANQNTEESSSAQTQAQSAAPKTVVVQSGDTLSSIAAQAGISVDQLKQLNNLNSNILVVGQQLML